MKMTSCSKKKRMFCKLSLFYARLRIRKDCYTIIEFFACPEAIFCCKLKFIVLATIRWLGKGFGSNRGKNLLTVADAWSSFEELWTTVQQNVCFRRFRVHNGIRVFLYQFCNFYRWDGKIKIIYVDVCKMSSF